MSRIIKNNVGSFLVICLIFMLMTGWIFSGWPQIWKKPPIPPKIQEAQAATESLSPDALLQQDNLTGAITDIDEDPDSPDDSWLTTTGSGSTLRVSYPTPTGNPTQGAGLQEFRLWLRKDAAGGGTPSCNLEVYENGSLHQTISTGNSITSTTGQILAGNWDASGLTNSDGSGVELRLVSTKGGGGPNERNIEVGAVEWNVDYTLPTDSDSAVEVHGDGAQSNFNLNPLNDTEGEKFSVLKFQIHDKATSDALDTLIDQITVDISGTGANASTDIVWAELWDDTGSSQVATSASITDSAITFGSTPNGGGTAGLDTIPNGTTIKYTVNVYMKNSKLTATDGQTYIFGINDSNIGTDTDTSASSQMQGNASAVSDVTGTITVTHSKIIFSIQPPSTATVDTDFSGQIAVSATDANNNVDKDFTEDITLSAVIDVTHAAPNGILSSADVGGLTKTPTNGTATWTDTKYSVAEVIDIKATSTSYTEYSTAVTVTGPTIDVISSTAQAPYVAPSTADNIMGSASIARSAAGTGTVTEVVLAASGTGITPQTDLANAELWLSSDDNWDPGDNQLGTAQSFDASGECTFSESFSVTETKKYLFVRLDGQNTLNEDDTIELQIKDITITTGEGKGGTSCDIGGTTTVWDKRKQLIFDNSAQAENLTNFPVLVKLTTSRVTYGDFGNADGTDLRFVDSNNTSELKYHIEKWNNTGDSFIWVKVPQIDGSSNTDFIYMYYGNSGASDVQEETNVWTNNYVMVQHLDESPANGVKGHLDSTFNDNDGTPYGFSGDATTDATGKVDGADTFDEALNDGHYLDCGSSTSLSITDNITLSVWLYPLSATTASDEQYFISKRKMSNGPHNYQFGYDYQQAGTYVEFAFYDGSSWFEYTTDTELPLNEWTYVAVTYTSGSDAKFYFNGSSVSAAQTAGSSDPEMPTDNAVPVYIGSYAQGYMYTPADYRPFDGTIDEARISDTARSADWIAAQYKSMSDTFITWPAAVSISITNNVVGFGTVALDTTKDNSGDLPVITVDSGPANLKVKSTVFTEGANTWSLHETDNGPNQVLWKFSKNGTDWAPFIVAGTEYPFDTNVPTSGTRNLYLRLTMPTETDSYNQYSSIVTIVAFEP